MASKTVTPKVPVALPKGPEGPGSVSAGAAASNALVGLDNALSGAIGARIQVTTTSGTFEGTLYTADPLSSLLILNTSPASSATASNISPTTLSAPTGAYRIVPLSQIQSFQLLSTSSSPTTTTTNQSPAAHLDTSALSHRLNANISSLQTVQARQGPRGTPPHAQALYDALSRTHPARWEGTNMVISDCFVIERPYQVANVGYYHDGGAATAEKQQNGNSGGAGGGFKGDLDRFRKVVEMELEKAQLRSGGTRAAPVLAAERKGG